MSLSSPCVPFQKVPAKCSRLFPWRVTKDTAQPMPTGAKLALLVPHKSKQKLSIPHGGLQQTKSPLWEANDRTALLQGPTVPKSTRWGGFQCRRRQDHRGDSMVKEATPP